MFFTFSAMEELIIEISTIFLLLSLVFFVSGLVLIRTLKIHVF